MKRLIRLLIDRVNSAAYRTGAQIVPVASSVRFGPALKRLKALGLRPATVFDVGVAYGTPDLYREFRDAHYHLIDPVPQAIPYMQRWATQLHASVHNIGLGEDNSLMPIDVRESIDGSTFFREVGPNASFTPCRCRCGALTQCSVPKICEGLACSRSMSRVRS